MCSPEPALVSKPGPIWCPSDSSGGWRERDRGVGAPLNYLLRKGSIRAPYVTPPFLTRILVAEFPPSIHWEGPALLARGHSK